VRYHTQRCQDAGRDTGHPGGLKYVEGMEPGLSWSPAWVVEPSRNGKTGPVGTRLVLSAGADRRVAIDGLDAPLQAAVRRWQADGHVEPTTADERRLVDRLVELQAVVPATGPEARRPVQLAGDPQVIAELADQLGPGWMLDAASDDGRALVVAVRTARDWPEVPMSRVHMGLDLALHHTIVLGPLVVPGASACLECLDARMAQTWPPSVAPPRPAALASLAVAAALLRVQIELIARGQSPLVNATIAWDLERGTTDRQALYKLAGCPTCDVVAVSGRVTLGWEAAAEVASWS
jgi:hypothetical protein